MAEKEPDLNFGRCYYCSEEPEIWSHTRMTTRASYRVECDCGFCGPNACTKREAVGLWNTLNIKLSGAARPGVEDFRDIRAQLDYDEKRLNEARSMVVKALQERLSIQEVNDTLSCAVRLMGCLSYGQSKKNLVDIITKCGLNPDEGA